MTDAVVLALKERLDRTRRQRATGMTERLRRLAAEVRDLPVLDSRSAEEIIATSSNSSRAPTPG